MTDLNAHNDPTPDDLEPTPELTTLYQSSEPYDSSVSTEIIAPLDLAAASRPTLPDVEELSLAQALGRLITRPGGTWRALGDASDRASERHRADRPRRILRPSIPGDELPIWSRRSRSGGGSESDDQTLTRPERKPVTDRPVRSSRRASSTADGTPELLTVSNEDYIVIPRAQPIQLDFSGPAIRVGSLITLSAMLVLWIVGILGGTAILAKGRFRTDADLMPGALLLVLSGIGFGIVVARTYSTLRLPGLNIPKEKAKNETEDDIGFFARFGARIVLFGVSLFGMIGAYTFNGGNQFSQLGTIAWIVGIVGLILTFMPGEIGVLKGARRVGQFIARLPSLVVAFRLTPTIIALTVIVLVGAWFRFNDLAAYPPDMTSDHVEKALDANLIAKGGVGSRPVFLPNNGGREVAHFYFLALLKNVTGLPMDMDLLKIGSGIEGVLGILAAFWFGRSFFQEEDKNLAMVAGLSMAAMVAVSYWHVMLSRLALRIVLTPLMTFLLLIFFNRALRHNRRWDWILSGLLLGIGVYCYQAMRMTPVYLIVGLILALVLRARNLPAVRSYIANFAILVIISLAVFAPMGRFMIDSPGEFWSRTTGRLFGEDTIEIKDPQTGAVTSRIANPQDRSEAFRKNVGFFGENMVRSVAMFNWHGDSAWVTGSSDANPQLDRFAGALLLLGLGGWVVRMVRRRDPADWLVPVGILVMLFPTALSLAFQIEVPSATRASGTIPFIYLLCGFAAAVILRQAWRALRHPILRVGIIGAALFVFALMANQNYTSYFVTAMSEYRVSTLPHAQAGKIMKGFSDSTGAPGNAFMVAFPYWWDHRALAINAEDIAWNNGVLQDNLQARLISMIQVNTSTPRYAFRVDRQVLFFLNVQDQASKDVLTKLFPGIIYLEQKASVDELAETLSVDQLRAYTEGRRFLVGIAPPVGCEWWAKYLRDVRLPEECLPAGRLP